MSDLNSSQCYKVRSGNVRLIFHVGSCIIRCVCLFCLCLKYEKKERLNDEMKSGVNDAREAENDSFNL